jgi:hypothetical protein
LFPATNRSPEFKNQLLFKLLKRYHNLSLKIYRHTKTKPTYAIGLVLVYKLSINTTSVVLNYSSILALHLIDVYARLILASKPQPTGITVTFHAHLADCGLWPNKNLKGQVRGQCAIELWYLLRGLDKQGAGSATINLNEAAKILQISLPSLRRRIKSGLDLGLFGGVVKGEVGQVRIFYKSLKSICTSLGIADPGACWEGDIADIPYLKFGATEAEAVKLQNQSQYVESRRKKKRSFKKLLSPEEMTSSELCNGQILFRRGRVTFLKRSANFYGGSQDRIAWNEGRHISTIQRRLSNGYREKHGLDRIAKTQLAVPPKTFKQEIPGRPPITRYYPGQHLITIPHLGKFRLTCNIYSINIELQSKRYARAKIKRSIQRKADQEMISDNWKLQPEYQAMRRAESAVFNKVSLSLTTSPPAGLPHNPSLYVEGEIEEGGCLKMI